MNVLYITVLRVETAAANMETASIQMVTGPVVVPLVMRLLLTTTVA